MWNFGMIRMSDGDLLETEVLLEFKSCLNPAKLSFCMFLVSQDSTNNVSGMMLD